jgi:hypothetical protein
MRLGDYVMSINEQNVCRASAKTVNKLIKANSTTTLRINLCRASSSVHVAPLTSSTNVSKSSSPPKPKSPQHLVKSLISCFNRQISLKTKKSIALKTEGQKYETEEDVALTIGNNNDMNDTIDYGYYSIPTSGGSLTSQKDSFSISSSSSSSSSSEAKHLKTKSFSSLSSVISSSSSLSLNELNQQAIDLDSIKFEIENFLNNMQLVIDVYVRPSAMLKIISVEQSLFLFQNIEKLVPVTRFILNMVNSYEQNMNKLPNAELVS